MGGNQFGFGDIIHAYLDTGKIIRTPLCQNASAMAPSPEP